MTTEEMFLYCLNYGFNRKNYELLAKINNATYLQISRTIKQYINNKADEKEKNIYKNMIKQNQEQRNKEQMNTHRRRTIIFNYLIKNDLSLHATLKIAKYFHIDIKTAQDDFRIYNQKYALEDEKEKVKRIRKKQKSTSRNKKFRDETIPLYKKWFNIIVKYHFNFLIVEDIAEDFCIKPRQVYDDITIYYQLFASDHEKEVYQLVSKIKNDNIELTIYDYLTYKEFSDESINKVKEKCNLSYDEVIYIINKYYQNKYIDQIQDSIKVRIKKILNN